MFAHSYSKLSRTCYGESTPCEVVSDVRFYKLRKTAGLDGIATQLI